MKDEISTPQKTAPSDGDGIPFILTKQEAAALARWHLSQVKKITKALGAAVLKKRAESLFPRGRELKAMHEVAHEAAEYHISRARVLALVAEGKTSH